MRTWSSASAPLSPLNGYVHNQLNDPNASGILVTRLESSKS
jgi:hypothetical protein